MCHGVFFSVILRDSGLRYSTLNDRWITKNYGGLYGGGLRHNGFVIVCAVANCVVVVCAALNGAAVNYVAMYCLTTMLRFLRCNGLQSSGVAVRWICLTVDKAAIDCATVTSEGALDYR